MYTKILVPLDGSKLAEVVLPYASSLATSQKVANSLIAMCTHGRTGMGRWVMGSVADRVVSYSGHPVLLIRSTGAAK
jgi:nucleotide-binding universal stress UspA family protein